MCQGFHDEIIGKLLDQVKHTINSENQNLRKWHSSTCTTARWDWMEFWLILVFSFSLVSKRVSKKKIKLKFNLGYLSEPNQ